MATTGPGGSIDAISPKTNVPNVIVPEEPEVTFVYPKKSILMARGARTPQVLNHMLHCIHFQGLTETAIIIAVKNEYIAVSRIKEGGRVGG